MRSQLGRLLSEDQILAWADAYFTAQGGSWPVAKSLDAPAPGVDDSWHAIHSALRDGYRGLPGGSSLFRLLKKYKRR